MRSSPVILSRSVELELSKSENVFIVALSNENGEKGSEVLIVERSQFGMAGGLGFPARIEQW
jgi:hypothetical protein